LYKNKPLLTKKVYAKKFLKTNRQTEVHKNKENNNFQTVTQISYKSFANLLVYFVPKVWNLTNLYVV
jgi:hypothetical protein